MGRSRNIALGALATALIAVGLAAQTGTVHVPHPSRAKAAVVAPAKHAPLTAAHPAHPAPAQPAQPAPPAPAPPPATNGDAGDGGDGGD